MRVFICPSGADTGGVHIAIKRAFDRHAPDWNVGLMVASTNYIDYPQDIPWDKLRLEQLYDAADAVFISNTSHVHEWYDQPPGVIRPGKPTVLMHHGWWRSDDYLGTNYANLVQRGRSYGAVQLGSTLDLELKAPQWVRWLPPPVDIAAMRRLRAQHYRPGDRIRIGHGPTDRRIKGSDAFDAAIASMQAKGLPVEKVLIERKSWADCLAIKATCDVWFDQPLLGYGMGAVEAWAMGIPVVAGIQDTAIREGMRDRWGTLPFADATEDTLLAVLTGLAWNEGERAHYVKRGTAHVERWHDERVTVEALKGIFESAQPTRPGGSLKRYTKQTLDKIARHAEREAKRAAVTA